MQNQRYRDMLKAHYRLFEKYERYPQGMNREQTEAYWTRFGEDITMFALEYKDCKPRITQLCVGLQDMLEAEYKDEWGKPEGKAEQVRMGEEATI